MNYCRRKKKEERKVALLCWLCLASFVLPSCLPYFLHACLLPCMPACSTGACLTFEIRLGFVRDSFGMPAFLPASLQVVRYCTALHVDIREPSLSDGVRSGFVRDLFETRSGCLPSCLPPCMHVDTGALIVGRDAFGIRSGFVWDSFGMPAFLPASLQVVRYCTALLVHVCRYGSPHCRTGCVRHSL